MAPVFLPKDGLQRQPRGPAGPPPARPPPHQSRVQQRPRSVPPVCTALPFGAGVGGLCDGRSPGNSRCSNNTGPSAIDGGAGGGNGELEKWSALTGQVVRVGHYDCGWHGTGVKITCGGDAPPPPPPPPHTLQNDSLGSADGWPTRASASTPTPSLSDCVGGCRAWQRALCARAVLNAGEKRPSDSPASASAGHQPTSNCGQSSANRRGLAINCRRLAINCRRLAINCRRLRVNRRRLCESMPPIPSGTKKVSFLKGSPEPHDTTPEM